MATKSNSQVTSLDDDVEVAPAPATIAPLAEAKTSGQDLGLSGKKRQITIHATNDEGGKEPVFVGLNGYGYHIPRGVPCNVPEEVYEILLNAKTTTLTALRQGGAEEFTAQRFAFTAA